MPQLLVPFALDWMSHAAPFAGIGYPVLVTVKVTIPLMAQVAVTASSMGGSGVGVTVGVLVFVGVRVTVAVGAIHVTYELGLLSVGIVGLNV